MVVVSMTQGRPWVHIIKFSLPLLAGAVLQQLYSTEALDIFGNDPEEILASAIKKMLDSQAG